MDTHVAAHTNPIRVDLSTGCALHFESVVIRLLWRIQRQKVRDTAGLSLSKVELSKNLPCEICCQGQSQHGHAISFVCLFIVVIDKAKVT